MKSKALWKLAVRVSPTAEEATAELLAEFFQTTASAFLHLEKQISTVTVFLTDRTLWTSATRLELQARLSRLADLGLNAVPVRLNFGRVRAEDWAESWKKHFRPLRVGQRLLIRPSWSRIKPRRGQAVVVLDPGLSFGTGQHPTTGFCLAQIAKHRQPGVPQSLLDIGTGSGILGIAAAKLGYGPVLAFDFDAEAVAVAKENAARNRVAEQMTIIRLDVAELKPSGKFKNARRQPAQIRLSQGRMEGYNLIAANLTANLLREHLDRILNCLASGGVLVLAGILKTEFAELSAACIASGLRPLAARTEKEWRSGSFLKLEA